MENFLKQSDLKRVKKIIESNLYQIVSLFDIDMACELEITKENRSYLRYTLEFYKEYLNMLNDLPNDIKKGFLQTLKDNELRHNQKVNNEDMFMLTLFNNLNKKNSIDLGLELIKKEELIKVADILLLHDTILDGSLAKKGLRTCDNRLITDALDNVIFVPILADDINLALESIVEYINKPFVDNEDIFVRPIVIHGLVGMMQAFNSANSRLGRLLQQLMIYDLTNQSLIGNLQLPALYMSKSYLKNKNTYYKNMFELAQLGGIDIWNNWIRYNLDAINEQIMFGKGKIKEITNHQFK